MALLLTDADKMKQIILGLLILFALTGCVANPIQFLPGQFSEDDTYINQISSTHANSSNEEAQLFDRYAQQSAGNGLIDYPRMELFLNDRLNDIKNASGIDGLAGKVYITAEEAYFARVSAEGNIYLPIEIVRDLQSEDELVALLAHELSHYILNHTRSDMFVNIQKKGVFLIGMVASTKIDESGTMNKREARQLRNALGALIVSDGILHPGYNRRQEIQADKLGVDLMIAAGYNPEAMMRLLEKLSRWEDQTNVLKEQNQELQRAMLAQARAEAGLDIEKHINLAFSDILFNLSQTFNDISSTHPDAEARIAAMQEYMQKHHRRASRPAIRSEAWLALVNSRETDQLIAAVKAVNQANIVLSQGKLTDATNLMLAHVNDSTRHQSFIRIPLFIARLGEGNRSGALTNIELGLKGKYPAFELERAQHVLRSTNIQELAERTIQLNEVFISYGKPSQHYIDVITLAEATDNQGLKASLMIECRIRFLGEPVACQPGEDAQSQELSFNRLMEAIL